jgi:hypothetical protein
LDYAKKQFTLATVPTLFFTLRTGAIAKLFNINKDSYTNIAKDTFNNFSILKNSPKPATCDRVKIKTVKILEHRF